MVIANLGNHDDLSILELAIWSKMLVLSPKRILQLQPILYLDVFATLQMFLNCPFQAGIEFYLVRVISSCRSLNWTELQITLSLSDQTGQITPELQSPQLTIRVDRYIAVATNFGDI